MSDTDGLVVRLKAWTNYAPDGLYREEWKVPNGEVGVFLRLGTEPACPRDESQRVDVEEVLRKLTNGPTA